MSQPAATFRFCTLACAVVLLGGCRGDGGAAVVRDLSGGARDMARPGDLAGADLTAPPADMSVGLRSTISDLLKNMTKGGTLVTIEGAVLTGPVRFAGTARSSKRCEYEAFIQDAESLNTPPPNGVRLFTTGQVCEVVDGGTCFCPFAPNSGTALDAMTHKLVDGDAEIGDLFTVTGRWSFYLPPVDGGAAPATHSITMTAGWVEKTGSNGVAKAFDFNDGKPFAEGGMGYETHESTLVKITPAMPERPTAPNNYGEYDYAGGHFDDAYRFIYNKMLDGGSLDPSKASYRSITGIPMAGQYPNVVPRTLSDFEQ